MIGAVDFWQSKAGAKTLEGLPKLAEPRQINTLKFFAEAIKSCKVKFQDRFCLTLARFAKMVPEIFSQQAFYATAVAKPESRFTGLKLFEGEWD